MFISDIFRNMNLYTFLNILKNKDICLRNSIIYLLERYEIQNNCQFKIIRIKDLYSRYIMKNISEIIAKINDCHLKNIVYKYYNNCVDNLEIQQNYKAIKYSNLYKNDINYIYFYIKENNNFEILKYSSDNIQYSIIYTILNDFESFKILFNNFLNYVINNYNILSFLNIDIINNIYNNTILFEKYNAKESYTCLDILQEHNILIFNIDEILPYNIKEKILSYLEKTELSLDKINFIKKLDNMKQILSYIEYNESISYDIKGVFNKIKYDIKKVINKIKNDIKKVINIFLKKFKSKTIIFFDNYLNKIIIYVNGKLFKQNIIKNPCMKIYYKYNNYNDFIQDNYKENQIKRYNYIDELYVYSDKLINKDIKIKDKDIKINNKDIKIKDKLKLHNILKFPSQKYNKNMNINFNYRR